MKDDTAFSTRIAFKKGSNGSLAYDLSSLSFFQYILLHVLSMIMSRGTLYTPVLQNENLQVIM